MSAEELLKSYAANRIALNAVKKKISLLIFNDGEFADIDLSDFREGWFEQGYAWKGWVAAIEDAAICDCGYKQEEMSLAVLLDKKASIRRECGDIKRRIYNAGKKLL